MLTLSSANAEKVIADRTSSFVLTYYEADRLATKIRAEVLDYHSRGDYLDSFEGVEIKYEHAGNAVFVSYSCEINDVQDMIVRLRLEQGKDAVLEWRTEYSQMWEPDDSLNVFDGTFPFEDW
jgi:hypothetical protein